MAEILSALVRLTRRDGSGASSAPLTQTGRDRAMDIYRHLPLERHTVRPLWTRMVRLAATLSVYDASYVALAEALSVPLITSDARIVRGYGSMGGSRCRIETV